MRQKFTKLAHELELGEHALLVSCASIVDDGSLDQVAKQAAVDETFAQHREYLDEIFEKAADDVECRDSAADDDGDEAMDETDKPICDMTDDERKIAEMKMRHGRAHRMRRALAKDDQENDMDVLLMAAERVAKGAPTKITKKEWWNEIEERAAKQRLEGETREQSISKFITDNDTGRLLFKAYQASPGIDPAAQVTETTVKVSASPPKPTRAFEQITAKAEALRKSDPKLTPEQAFAKVYETEHDLRSQDRAEHEARVAKAVAQ